MRHTTHKSEQEIFDLMYHSLSKDGTLIFAGRLLERAARLYGDITALIYQGNKISYNQLYGCAVSFTDYVLSNFNIKARDRAIICLENSPEFYVAYYGLWQAGIVVVPTNIYLKEQELAHIIRDSESSLIITSSDKVELFQKSNLSLPPIITEKDIALTCNYNSPKTTSQTQQTQSYRYDLEDDEVAALIYTSGTTGFPKGAMLSSKNIMTNVMQIAARLDIPHGERLFGVLPLFHSFAQNTCVWTSVFYGVTVIVIPKIERRYILEGLEHKPTVFIGVPALYGFMCLLKKVDLDSVRLFVSGGDALPDKIRAAFALLYRRRICNGYGLTETAPVISVDIDDQALPTSNAGKPLVGISCNIRDEKGVVLKRNEIGVLWVKGDNVMLGYYHMEQATHEILRDGWLNTGDLGYLDNQGRIVITGREKDLIINKGVNIYPQEIENILLLHTNVLRAAVVGKKDDAEGEVPVAFIQMRTHQDDIERVLRNLCAQHLASYKIPRRFICDTKDLPSTATGKVDKKVLRKEINKHE